MAKNIYNNPIDKTVNWSGDENTGGLPVSGEMVQKFIKDTLNQKAGVFHYDTANNRYLVFADEDSRNNFLLDPTQIDLVLGTFDAPFNYAAEINLTSPSYNAVFLGSTGNYIDFTFDIKNKQGSSTGENVTVTYTFIRNATRQVFTENRKFGDTVHFNIDKYLGEGTNTIMVGITGQTSLAATTAAITYQVVNLTFTENLDISKVYDLTKGEQQVEIPFTVSGYGTKTVEWYLNGELIPFVKEEDEIVDVTASRTKHITLSNLSHGINTLQMRAYTVINGERFYTDTAYRELMVYTGANNDLIISVAINVPKEYGVLGADDVVAIYDIVQYIPYHLRFATYSPSNAANTEVTLTLDDVVIGSVNSVNEVINEFIITSTTSGTKTFVLSAGTLSREFNVEVSETDIALQDIQTGLVLDFSAVGKTNNSVDKDYWVQGDFVGTFEGFDWNKTSGWNNGRLEMKAGSSFGINYAPLSGKPTDTGKTIEIEWSTKNVVNDDAVICDMRNENGTGLLITATKVSLTSANGVTVDTEYKSGENVRVAFVINKASGVTNQHLSFIYANGVLSRCETWAVNDSYTSDKEILFTASAEAEISLKAIRIYDLALTSDNILNNYILYRDSVAEMMNVYDRNDVYEDGTVTFSPDKMMGRLPVMIVTGDIPVLENTSDKDTQIVVDIEYHNLQDSSKSFAMKNAAMRPQGTSSMGYPKKNFRIYTQKVANTILYDANGKEVADKLYSFKEGAQPVACWCLKADYAESSGTHNTGIARLWNEALFNAQIDGEYKLRTEAQKAAVESKYPYDVRTTIDGFPILLFYRQTANDNPIFIGKYNFNNDKSTESVFGFTGIPNFDNSKMQCWEILNNGNALALFTSTDGFDEAWSEAFESRYPDTKTPYTGDLKAFCEWMTNISQEDFATQKWEHLDVYKMAAYWVYLMRHAAADQFVKNAMFTSEDGQKFYFILYDNDTINGLINTGDIRIKPTDGRQTVDESGSYVFAGHDSRLWNMLEADEEFQEIVAKVDNALYSAGISYLNTVKIFDTEQADKWAERVYNQDAQYKYIGPYNEKGVNNLFMLQGKRDLHRKWWLAKRFSIYDAKYVSGTYKSEAIEIKCLNGTEPGQQFSITAGYPLDYGYGINNVPRAKGISLQIGESHTFTTGEVVNVGDPIRIYGAPNIAELDLSQMTDRIAKLSVASANSDTLGTKMTKLVVGNSSANNVELSEISGLKELTSLEYLDIQGIKNLNFIDLSSQSQLKTLKAYGSGITSATFAKGAPIERLELPSTLTTLTLDELPKLTFDNILLESGLYNIPSISIKGCPNLSKDFNWVYDWYVNKQSLNETSSFVMDNVDWKDVNADQLVEISQIGNIQLKGKVTVIDITIEQLNALINVFGESAFDKNAELFINAPDAIFVTGRTELLEGESEDYACIVFGGEVQSLTWSIYSGGSSSYTTIDVTTGLLTTKEGSGARTLTIRVIARTDVGTKTVDTTVKVVARTYPASGTTTLSGSTKLNNTREVYNLDVSTPNVNGEYVVTWSLTGMDGYAEIESSNNKQCVVKKLQEATTVLNGTLTASVKKKYNNGSLFSKTFAIELVNDTIAETDKGIVTALYNAGLCANSAYITKAEAALITDVDLQPGTSSSTSVFYSQSSNIKTFDGLKHFTGLRTLKTYALHGLGSSSNKTPISITFPEGLEVIEPNSVYFYQGVKSVSLPSTLVSIGQGFASNVKYDISKDNPHFIVEDGSLLSVDKAVLWHLYLSDDTTDYVLPSNVTLLKKGAISNVVKPLNTAIFHKDVVFEDESCGIRANRLYVDSYIKYTTFIASGAGFSDRRVETLILGKNCNPNTDFWNYSGRRRYFGSIEVEDGHPYYVKEGPCLYSLSGTTLYDVDQDFTGYINVREGVKTAKKYSLMYLSCSGLKLPEGFTTFEEPGISADSSNLIEVDFPSTLTSAYYLVSSAPNLEIIKMRRKAVLNPSTIAFTGAGSNAKSPKIIVPVSAVDDYKANSRWLSNNGLVNKFEIVPSYEPTECISLSIVAGNVVSGRDTSTFIDYTALTNGYDYFTEEQYTDIEVTGTSTFGDFDQNTTDEPIIREASFEYLGVLATTTFTHGAWNEAYYTVDLNNDNWEGVGYIPNPDRALYDGVYQSLKGRGESCGKATMYIDIVGYETFKFYIRSNGGSSCYVMVWKLDTTPPSGAGSFPSTSYQQANTKSEGNTANTDLGSYVLVEFTGIDKGSHRITIVYQRSQSSSSGADRGYVLIPKDQNWEWETAE